MAGVVSLASVTPFGAATLQLHTLMWAHPQVLEASSSVGGGDGSVGGSLGSTGRGEGASLLSKEVFLRTNPFSSFFLIVAFGIKVKDEKKKA